MLYKYRNYYNLTLYFDLLDIKIADKRMKDIKEGKSKLIPAEDVYKELGL